MLEKGACDMLLAPLVRSTNYRVREVALGVLGNMLCHSKHAKVMKVSAFPRVFSLKLHDLNLTESENEVLSVCKYY